ncbi:hypothetical protein ADK38_13670, partial [Streptomyces varsoviensis]
MTPDPDSHPPHLHDPHPRRPCPPCPHLRLDTADGIATVTLSNPAKRNAMTPAMWRELPRLLRRGA